MSLVEIRRRLARFHSVLGYVEEFVHDEGEENRQWIAKELKTVRRKLKKLHRELGGGKEALAADREAMLRHNELWVSYPTKENAPIREDEGEVKGGNDH